MHKFNNNIIGMADRNMMKRMILVTFCALGFSAYMYILYFVATESVSPKVSLTIELDLCDKAISECIINIRIGTTTPSVKCSSSVKSICPALLVLVSVSVYVCVCMCVCLCLCIYMRVCLYISD